MGFFFSKIVTGVGENWNDFWGRAWLQNPFEGPSFFVLYTTFPGVIALLCTAHRPSVKLVYNPH
jgi:hypothetical protein